MKSRTPATRRSGTSTGPGGKGRGRRIAIFGGTFDPVHAGHLAVARAAQQRFQFDQMFFIPAGRPPHKRECALSPYNHRYAMTALACAGHRGFVPSLAESGADGSGSRIFYSVDTVRRFRKEMMGPGDRLYFLVGADSFLQLPSWKNYATLLELCDFVVASRPGFRGDLLRDAIPARLLAADSRAHLHAHLEAGDSIALRRSVVHLLRVTSPVSATQVRERVRAGQSIRGLVPGLVEEYITKQALYK